MADKFANVGKFVDWSWVPGDLEGGNLIRKLHKNYEIIGPDKPNDIAVRIIEIPPMGEIPVHDHDTDEFTSWLICLRGNGEHVVEIDGKTNTHAIASGGSTVSTQSQITQIGPLKYRHGFKAGKEGMVLMNIYRESDISDERLNEIQNG